MKGPKQAGDSIGHHIEGHNYLVAYITLAAESNNYKRYL